MRAALLAALLLAAPSRATASEPVSKALVHHPVSTRSAQAQERFDEGLTLIYAFNREESQRRFRAAAAADPKLAIAWWGVALAAGPNLNVGMTRDDWNTVRDALTRAQSLQAEALPEERRLIAALAARYPAGATAPAGDAYREAMAAVYRDFPADADAATLYVESAMDSQAWGYGSDGKPLGDTEALAAILSTVLARAPAHPGANHYLIHIYDQTSVAARALPSANALSALPVEPAASHLRHMSGHIYFDLGMYAELQRDNREAVDDDRAYAAATRRDPATLDYYFHNLDFYTGGSLMLGDELETDRAIGFFRDASNPNAMLALDRSGRYAEALRAIPEPAAGARPYWLARWRYARGIANVSLGHVDAAQAELTALNALAPPAAGWQTRPIHALAALLGARIAYARGNAPSAIEALRGVIADSAAQPPESFAAWYYPIGEWLGWMLLESGDAAGAEKAFRADLIRVPHNPRALYGLMQALSAQDRTQQGDAYSGEIGRTWRGRFGDLSDPLRARPAQEQSRSEVRSRRVRIAAG
jgi:hypothetical protein